MLKTTPPRVDHCDPPRGWYLPPPGWPLWPTPGGVVFGPRGVLWVFRAGSPYTHPPIYHQTTCFGWLTTKPPKSDQKPPKMGHIWYHGLISIYAEMPINHPIYWIKPLKTTQNDPKSIKNHPKWVIFDIMVWSGYIVKCLINQYIYCINTQNRSKNHPK